jgi:hypothetical protein
MAYETGSATSQHDLLDKLRIFLVANGWTQNKWAVEGSGYGLCVQKELVFANFRSVVLDDNILGFWGLLATSAGIFCNTSTGYAAGSVVLGQPGSPLTKNGYKYAMLMPTDTSNIEEYYFFTSGNNIDVVAKKNAATSGYYSMHVGEVSEKFGDFYHCSYFAGLTPPHTIFRIDTPFSRANAIVAGYGLRVTSGSTVEWYGVVASDTRMSFYYDLVPNFGNSTSVLNAGFSTSLMAIPASPSGNITLYPIYIGAYRSSTAVPLGIVSTLRTCNATYVTDGDEITIGADVWKLFKLACGYGWAFKKVV